MVEEAVQRIVGVGDGGAALVGQVLPIAGHIIVGQERLAAGVGDLAQPAAGIVVVGQAGGGIGGDLDPAG